MVRAQGFAFPRSTITPIQKIPSERSRRTFAEIASSILHHACVKTLISQKWLPFSLIPSKRSFTALPPTVT